MVRPCPHSRFHGSRMAVSCPRRVETVTLCCCRRWGVKIRECISALCGVKKATHFRLRRSFSWEVDEDSLVQLCRVSLINSPSFCRRTASLTLQLHRANSSTRPSGVAEMLGDRKSNAWGYMEPWRISVAIKWTVRVVALIEGCWQTQELEDFSNNTVGEICFIHQLAEDALKTQNPF